MNKGDDEEMPIAPHVATAKDAKQSIAFPIDRTHLIAAAGPLASSTTVTLEDGQGTRIKAKITAHDHGLALLEVNPADISGPGLNYFNIAPRFTALTLRCVALPDSDVFARHRRSSRPMMSCRRLRAKAGLFRSSSIRVWPAPP